MNLGQISTKITNLTGADTTAYPTSDRVIDINIWQQKIGSMILDSQDESDFDDIRRSDYPIVTTPLTTSRDYAISQGEGVLGIKNLSVSYDGVNIYRATPLDSNEVQFPVVPASETTANATLDGYFDKTAPRYDFKYGSVFIYPKPEQSDVDAGGFIVMEWEREIQDFTEAEVTTGTVTPCIDSSFHAILAYGPAYEYCLAKQLPQVTSIKRMLDEYEARLRAQYSFKQKDRRYSLQSELIYENFK